MICVFFVCENQREIVFSKKEIKVLAPKGPLRGRGALIDRSVSLEFYPR